MRIVIEVEATPRVKRALRALLFVGALTASGVAFAAPPKEFVKGEPLTAQKMNDNFAGLDDRLAALEDQSETGVLRVGNQQIVYGVATSGGSGYVTVTFPHPFLSDSGYTIVASAGEAGTAGGSSQVSPVDKTKAVVQFNGQGAGHPIHWVAIGRWN